MNAFTRSPFISDCTLHYSNRLMLSCAVATSRGGGGDRGHCPPNTYFCPLAFYFSICLAFNSLFELKIVIIFNIVQNFHIHDSLTEKHEANV